MKNLHIHQTEEIVIIDFDDNRLVIEKTKYEVVPIMERRLDENIAEYPITYTNLCSMVREIVGDSTPGNKIQAIKIVRRLFSPMGLRESKEIVDTIMRIPVQDSQDFPY